MFLLLYESKHHHQLTWVSPWCICWQTGAELVKISNILLVNVSLNPRSEYGKPFCGDVESCGESNY